jgi:hypothetical protein
VFLFPTVDPDQNNSEMATKIPQIIRMRSNRHCVQPRISYYWKGIMHPCADPGQLIREVNDINDRVDKIDMEAYIEITIEYAKARTITLIDLPGIFVASSKKNPNISADDIDKLVAKWVLDRPNDRILLIQRMNDDGTTVKAPHMVLGVSYQKKLWFRYAVLLRHIFCSLRSIQTHGIPNLKERRLS